MEYRFARLQYYFPANSSVYQLKEYKELKKDTLYYFRKCRYRWIAHTPFYRYCYGEEDIREFTGGTINYPLDPSDLINHIFWWYYGKEYIGPYRLDEDLYVWLCAPVDKSDLIDFTRLVNAKN